MANVTTPLIPDSGKVSNILGKKLTWQAYSMILLFSLATLIRIIDTRAPGKLVEREYTSAIFARTFFFDHNPAIESWRLEIAHKVMDEQPILEPPVTEYFVSIIYRLLDREELWYSRLLTSSFWLVSGIFLYKLTKKILLAEGALVATSYYLLVPSGIIISRSFQPDSLMMMMFLISIYCIMRYFDKPSLKSLFLAAFLSGLTLLLRPLVIFALFCVFISLSVLYKRTWRVFFDRHFVLFILISLALPVIYYGYGIFFAGYMRWKVTTSFLPYLFVRKEFWMGWFQLGLNTVGLTALLAGLVGFWLLKIGPLKALSLGLGIGYLFFGMFFNYHVSTHAYYHLQLLPLVSICITPTIALLINALKGTATRFWWVPAVGAILIIVITGYWQVKGSLNAWDFENPKTAQEIGEIVNHSDKTVFVAYHYGLPLEYYGELFGKYWARSINYWLVRYPLDRERSVQERLTNLGFVPDYFIITDFQEYSVHHKDLQNYLVRNCSLLAKTDQYLIYNACLQ
jgi:4-amino-4-deoxy-L-arabinose transferase-like glycosyltransferase